MPKKVYLIKLSRVRYTECILGQFYYNKKTVYYLEISISLFFTVFLLS